MDGQQHQNLSSAQQTRIQQAIVNTLEEELIYDQQLNIEAVGRITKEMADTQSQTNDAGRRDFEYVLHTYMFDLTQQLIPAEPVPTTHSSDETANDGSNSVICQILALIDIMCVLSDNGTVDGALAFNLVEEAMDMVSITVAQEIFGHLERRAPLMRRNIIATGGKGIVMLKMCNNLLRRIPHSTMSQFAGRVQTYVANSFPLSERSGVNLRGDFDQSNLPALAAPVQEDDRDLYQAFWSLQEYFANPQKLVTLEHQESGEYSMERFIKAATTTIDEFRKTNTTKSQPLELDSTGAETLKYLTAPTLLRMQFSDTLFKCQILFQLLIFIKYVLSMSGDRLQMLKKTATNKFVVNEIVISSADDEALRELRKRANGQLVVAANNRGLFSRTSQFVLFHDNIWSRWKAESCKPFEKALDEQQEQALAEELRASGQMFLDAREARYANASGSDVAPMGSRQLADLWTVKTEAADLVGLGREVCAIDVLAAMNRLDLYCRDDADYDMLTTSEQERADVLQWRALRSSVFDNMFRTLDPASKSLAVLREEVFPKDDASNQHDDGNDPNSPMDVES
ncbi:hypothetical protein IW140_005700 [Coemansia sp. RSA 1813]|nr:hypothetical protein EV178_006195 [Coemansia sp. RSA 1646]KAJ1768272.1 hypothetical protein LPJ74_004937 [Coemansia sp. RSA 1843]KAJ2210612.1 hypothetical protein EV179_006108 [Coemansia sp. RSA 487]KAJ2564554.1 hypothetical protein IW140_005700 [Coemansia sp. RSA 1813]